MPFGSTWVLAVNRRLKVGAKWDGGSDDVTAVFLVGFLAALRNDKSGVGGSLGSKGHSDYSHSFRDDKSGVGTQGMRGVSPLPGFAGTPP